MIACSSGNWPVWSFEYKSSPFAFTSNAPPPTGMSFNSETFCLNVLNTRAAKLTAFGS